MLLVVFLTAGRLYDLPNSNNATRPHPVKMSDTGPTASDIDAGFWFVGPSGTRTVTVSINTSSWQEETHETTIKQFNPDEVTSINDPAGVTVPMICDQVKGFRMSVPVNPPSGYQELHLQIGCVPTKARIVHAHMDEPESNEEVQTLDEAVKWHFKYPRIDGQQKSTSNLTVSASVCLRPKEIDLHATEAK